MSEGPAYNASRADGWCQIKCQAIVYSNNESELSTYSLMLTLKLIMSCSVNEFDISKTASVVFCMCTGTANDNLNETDIDEHVECRHIRL